MSNTERKRVLNYRNDNGLAPNPDNIDYGEIAIGYKKDNEAIYIKNTANGIVDFTPISIVNITYNELKKLRDNAKLKPSQYYRITDFVTTVANDPEAQSAGHPFDIIVLASNKNRLQEECYAIQHKDDTYFANCNLAAWKIWYCLDNNNTKYMWADTVNGKGVIYRMIDEWQNDCPYDFKNVQFKRYAVADASSNGALADLAGKYIGYNSDMAGLSIPNTNDFIWAYTFSIGEQIGEPGDASIIGYNSFDVGEGYGEKGYYGDNTIKPSSSRSLIDGVVHSVFCLNNIVWWTNNTINRGINGNRIESECFNMTLSGYGTIIEYDCFNLIMGGYICYGNFFKSGCSCNTFGDDCYGNSFGNNCYSNTFGNGCSNNKFGNECDSNTFGNGCYSNKFGDVFANNTFGNNCYGNSFGNGCYRNTFGNKCNSNTFGNGCYGNSFGNDCYSNTFGNDCYSNSFGNNFVNNTFGNGCYRNTFGDGCNNNTFRNGCSNNKFGDVFENNTFGKQCSSNSFGVDCYSNSFGNNCDNNTFGNNCIINTFGNGCTSNTFKDDCRGNTFGSNCDSNSFGNRCGGNTFVNNCDSNSFGDDCSGNSFGN